MRVIFWVVLAVLGSSPVHAGNKTAACKVKSDCALVPADCCGCAGGGQQKAIPAREKAKYEKERQARCAGTMCTTMMSQDSSCAETAVAVCKEGQCTLAQSR
jgi:hypothetical protein